MKHNYFFLSFGILLLLAAGCSKKSEVAATIDGKPITVEELDQAFGGRIGQQIYELRRQALDFTIEEKLLEQAAKEKGLSIDDFLKQEVETKVSEPSEAEIKTIYEANLDRFGKDFEAAKRSIAGQLKRNRASIQQNNLIAQLKQKSKVEIKLQKPPVPRVDVAVGNNPCLGPEGAPVTVIEFTDFQCPFCGRARGTIDQILETYPNDVRYCYRDFPLSFHADAQTAAIAAECAFEQDETKGWAFFRKLFDNQRALKPADLKNYAAAAGLEGEAFAQCLDGQKFAEAVQKDFEEGSKAGVSGTPGFFINGILISGAQPFDKFKEVIDEELAKKK